MFLNNNETICTERSIDMPFMYIKTWLSMKQDLRNDFIIKRACQTLISVLLIFISNRQCRSLDSTSSCWKLPGVFSESRQPDTDSCTLNSLRAGKCLILAWTSGWDVEMYLGLVEEALRRVADIFHEMFPCSQVRHRCPSFFPFPNRWN